MPVAEFQLDVEGLAVSSLGLVQPTLLLRDSAKLVVNEGEVAPVAELQIDVEGLAVGGFGCLEPALFICDPAELEISDGLVAAVV